MKLILSASFGFLCSLLPCLSGSLDDKANIFGPDGAKVRAALDGRAVWIETLVAQPDGLKAYADDKIKGLTNRGFLVVITTQPRSWRISMTNNSAIHY